ncbi:MAG: DegV family protein [Butyrivibrio sp.]|nr:DegV family protein [Acetatifactor muris]MCM1558786.1 DegV family protein [Butyrivibrio sp.]
MGIHIITDSASDIKASERENLTVIPMTITFGETEYQDGVTLNHKQFYEMLIESDALPVTSQIPPFQFEEAMKKAVAQGHEVIAITMSGKLSGTWQSAMVAAEKFPGSVYVVDSENVTVGEHVLVDYAFRLIEQGAGAAEITEKLNLLKKRIRLVALLNTLEYLKKGGRISGAVALAGNILSIKPVIAIQDGEVAILGKARGSKQANNLIVEQIQAAGGIDFSMPYFLGYTGLSQELIQKYIKDNAALWESETDSLPVDSVGGTIGTHTGPGAIAVAFVAKEH